MFSKTKQNPTPAPKSNNVSASNHTFSIIASDVEIIGNLAAKVDIHIDGSVQGDIACGSLVQGSDSKIAGKIIAEQARLAGIVDGSIEARDLIIEASAHISGDIQYETLTIEQGSKVDGQFKHISDAKSPKLEKSTINRDTQSSADPLILSNQES